MLFVSVLWLTRTFAVDNSTSAGAFNIGSAAKVRDASTTGTQIIFRYWNSSGLPFTHQAATELRTKFESGRRNDQSCTPA
jgi:hypothetical protein